jgi:ribonuclease Z
MMIRTVGILGVLIVIGIALVYGFRAPLALRLVEGVVADNMSSSLLDELPEGLHVVLCGAGSPLPDPDRSGPCVAVVAAGRLYVVDAGSGASRTLARLRLPQGRVEAVFLTHFHSDHIDGLGELMLQRWAGGAKRTPTPVYGPLGVGRVVEGFNRAYAQDVTYRVAHHGEEVVPRAGAGGRARPFGPPVDGEGRVVFEADDLRITAFRVDHRPVEPAVGYRFDHAARTLVVSGDTRKSANLAKFAEGVDLLVHEGLSPRLVSLIGSAAAEAGRDNIAKITTDIVDYHTTPVEAAEIARDADVGALLYYHIVPPLPLAPLEDVFLEGVDEVYRGPVYVGRDGTLLSLPAGSEAIEHRELL